MKVHFPDQRRDRAEADKRLFSQRENQRDFEKPSLMDWGQSTENIRNLTAQPSEILGAILNAPPDQLPAILEAIADGVRTGAIIITSYEWRPALNRLMALDIPWPGPQCQQCGSPLGEEGSDNNYGPGICYFCWEG